MYIFDTRTDLQQKLDACIMKGCLNYQLRNFAEQRFLALTHPDLIRWLRPVPNFSTALSESRLTRDVLHCPVMITLEGSLVGYYNFHVVASDIGSAFNCNYAFHHPVISGILTSIGGGNS